MVYDRQSRIYGIRIAPDGTVLDPGGGFQISSASSEEDAEPTLAYDGTNYLVVWQRGRYLQGDRILGAQVSPSGIHGTEFYIESDASTYSSTPSVSFDGANYLVAWCDRRNAPNVNATNIYAARVTQSGSVLDPEGFPVTGTASFKQGTHTIFDGTQYQISWNDIDYTQSPQPNYPSIYLDRDVSVDGSVLNGSDSIETLNISTGVIIGGSTNYVLWSAAGSIVNTGGFSFAIWADPYNFQNKLMGVFIYPK